MASEQQSQMSYEERAQIMKAKARKARRANRGEQKPGVGLNSLLDIMSILLFVLLLNIGADPLNVKQDEDLRIPQSTVDIKPDSTLTITISRQYVLVSDRRVLTLNEGRIDQTDLASAESALIPELQSATEEVLAQRSQLGSQVGRDYAKTATIICDHRTQYNVLARVMRSAAAGGVESFRFAVIHRSQGSVPGATK